MSRPKRGWRAAVIAAAALSAAGYLWGQTKIDLPTQGKRIDFAQASSTRPVKTDVNLPMTCAVGELFFESDAEAGGNLYGCTATNQWTSLGAPFSGMVTTLGDLRIRRDSATQVTIGANCSAASRCNVRLNDTVFTFADSATVSNPSGIGTVWFGVSATGERMAWHNLTALTCNGMTCVSGMEAMPADVIPIGTCEVGVSQFDENGCADLRAIFGRDVVTAGAGLSRTGNTLSLNVSVPVFNAGITPPAATCVVGEAYLRTDTNQSYACASTDVWVETSNQATSMASDPASPETGRVWHNSTENVLKARLNSTNIAIASYQAGTLLPGTCVAGETYLRADTNQSYACTSANVWTETSNRTLSGASDPSSPETGRVWHNSTEDALKARLTAATVYLVRTSADMQVAGAGSYPVRVTGAHSVDAVSEGRWNRQSAGEFESGSLESGGWVRMAGNGSGAAKVGFFDGAVSTTSPVFEATSASGAWTLARNGTASFYLKHSTGSAAIGQTACDPGSSVWSVLIRDCAASGGQTRLLVQAADGQTTSEQAVAVQQSNATAGGGTVAWASSFAGQVVRYAGEDTAGIGQAFLKAEAAAADQTGDASASTLVAAGASNAGTYRICAVVSVKTTAATTLALPVTYRSPASASDLVKNLLNGVSMAANEEHDACMVIRSTGDSAITVDASDIGAAVADIRIYVERMGF